jgi:hypothetical protein
MTPSFGKVLSTVSHKEESKQIDTTVHATKVPFKTEAIVKSLVRSFRETIKKNF